MDKKDIKNFTLEELKALSAGMGQPIYKAKQVFSWLYKKGVREFNEMHNVSKALREILDKNYYISNLKLCEHLKSADGTEKFLFKLSDGNFIESVLIYGRQGKTMCISTQVGCKFACSFCGSGCRGFVRNLTTSEIVNQILFLQHDLKHKITNYVFMGMGEPLDNYGNMLKTIMIMNAPEGMNIGARRITVSTCGIVPGIDKLEELGLQVNLALSLHATDEKTRSEIMPINKKYPLKELIKACRNFVRKKGRTITIEYMLLQGKNDFIKNADDLAKIARTLKAKVNLIPYSVIPNIRFYPTPKKTRDIFVKKLISRGVNVTVRASKGKDIKAACGQLAGRQERE